MEQAVYAFRVEGKPVTCERYGFGHINKTYRIVTSWGNMYELQRINRHVFTNIPNLMENIGNVTRYAAQRVRHPMEALCLVPTVDGKDWYEDADGNCWRMYHHIENSICFQRPASTTDFYESAKAFGSFQEMMAGFPAEKLHETIPDFHNTPARYRQFHKALEEDKLGRAQGVQKEIDFFLTRESGAGLLVDLLAEGKLPLLVTHNDTMLNNVLFDRTSRKAVCVVDLDTVMPGLSAYDFGDSIRFGANLAAEDEVDASKAGLDLGMYQAYLRGYLETCPSLTAQELKRLPDGARLMTLECGLRFLTDYLQGDPYFAPARPGQNLDRCRTQMGLVQDMENQWDAMAAAL